MNMSSKLAWIAAAVLGVFVVATFAGIVSAGPLDPSSSPLSTMVTQNELPPAWHQSLSATGGCASQRFDCVLASDAAVLDKETGLVWERAPQTTTHSLSGAVNSCLSATTGFRTGWRLPSAHEVRSLYNASGGTLPAGHPFNPPPFNVWTASDDPSNSANGYSVTSAGVLVSVADTSLHNRWCIRAAGGENPN